jgi:hypothetical protein
MEMLQQLGLYAHAAQHLTLQAEPSHDAGFLGVSIRHCGPQDTTTPAMKVLAKPNRTKKDKKTVSLILA